MYSAATRSGYIQSSFNHRSRQQPKDHVGALWGRERPRN